MSGPRSTMTLGTPPLVLTPASASGTPTNILTVERVGEMYEEYFAGIHAVYAGKGWYEANGARKDLDWLTRRYPWPCSKLT